MLVSILNTDINIAFPLNIATVVLSTSTMHDACIDSIRIYTCIHLVEAEEELRTKYTLRITGN